MLGHTQSRRSTKDAPCTRAAASRIEGLPLYWSGSQTAHELRLSPPSIACATQAAGLPPVGPGESQSATTSSTPSPRSQVQVRT
nr:hypothetical protein [Serinicoccus marinus]